MINFNCCDTLARCIPRLSVSIAMTEILSGSQASFVLNILKRSEFLITMNPSNLMLCFGAGSNGARLQAAQHMLHMVCAPKKTILPTHHM